MSVQISRCLPGRLCTVAAPGRALLDGMRLRQSEVQLTNVLAAVLDAEPAMASGFVAAALRLAPHQHPVAGDTLVAQLPAAMRCAAERGVDGGRADLTFSDSGDDGW